MSSLLEQLKQKTKLNKVEVKTEEKRRPQLCEDESAYLEMMDNTKLEKYLDLISAYSFESKIFTLSKDMAREIIVAHNDWLKRKEEIDFTTLPNLFAAIKEMQSFFQNSKWDSLFIRLSTRSPKDAALTRPSISSSLREEYKTLAMLEEGSGANELSTILHALYRVSTFLMRNKNVTEAMQLIIESKRIQSDLAVYINDGVEGDFNFILREFAKFDPENEFRVFCYNGKLTGITQYNEVCFFPRLQDKMDSLFTPLINSFISEVILPILPSSLNNCVIDIILIHNGEGVWQVKVVEVNPFAEFAGSGLFKWGIKHDWEVLMGEMPMESRFTKVPPSKASLGSDWVNVVKEAGINAEKFF